MLVFGVVGTVSTIPALFDTTSLQAVYGDVPAWFPLYTVLGIMGGVINFVGIWLWKKWVFYTLTCSTAIALIMQVLVLKPVIATNLNPLMYAITLVGAGLWFWAIYRKRHYFE